METEKRDVPMLSDMTSANYMIEHEQDTIVR